MCGDCFPLRSAHEWEMHPLFEKGSVFSEYPTATYLNLIFRSLAMKLLMTQS